MPERPERQLSPRAQQIAGEADKLTGQVQAIRNQAWDHLVEQFGRLWERDRLVVAIGSEADPKSRTELCRQAIRLDWCTPHRKAFEGIIAEAEKEIANRSKPRFPWLSGRG